MEWLILLFLVPAILVPVVLLCGFAGCNGGFGGYYGDGDQPPPVIPPIVQAAPKNVDHITVSWQNADSNPGLAYRFVRMKGGVTETDTEVDASVTSVDDTRLDAATDYTYQVSTATADGYSDPAAVTVSTFQPAFQVDAGAAPNNQPGFAGDFTFVQRISAGKLLATGGKVGIKVRGAPASNVTINSIYISQVGGGNPWNSAGDLTPVMTSALTLPDDQPKDLDPIDYNLDKKQDLIIAFDFTAASGADTIGYVSPELGVTSYVKAGVQQASLPTRDPGYSTGNSQLYLVVTIGVP